MSHIITAAEAKQLGLKPMGKKHPLRAELEMLETGEHLFIAPEDFEWKRHTPLLFTNKITRQTGKKFKVMEAKDKKGWVAERVA